jgi:hypothetical protein
MPLIPLSGKPVVYVHQPTGIRYTFKAPTDETYLSIIDLESKYPSDDKERAKLFEDKRKYLQWINEHINLLLLGWTVPVELLGILQTTEYPSNGDPAAVMPWELKVVLYTWYMSWSSLSIDEVKN